MLMCPRNESKCDTADSQMHINVCNVYNVYKCMYINIYVCKSIFTNVYKYCVANTTILKIFLQNVVLQFHNK